MSLVKTSEIQKAAGLQKLGFIGYGIASILSRFFGLSDLNKVYDKYKHLKDQEFLDAIIEEFNLEFEIHEDDLKRIPKEGSFISISNHPLGGADGILLMKILSEHRSDYKIMGNFLLHKIDPLKKYIFPVNPFENHKEVHNSFKGIKECLQYLKDGHPLGLFPAGEVSVKDLNGDIQDKDWEESAIKIIKKANVPILPVYFNAKNSPFFYKLAKTSDVLRTAKLPSELFRNKKNRIKIRIGKPIQPNVQKEYESLEDFGKFIRKKTYMLANSFNEEKSSLKDKFPKIRSKKEQVEELIPAVEVKFLEQEFKLLKEQNLNISTTKDYELYLADSEDIPSILIEIGRLREHTFRQVGEGTNRSLDLDHYDQYYQHLILWDSKVKKIAGSYRMGIGAEIYKKYGKEGFYVTELFNFDSEVEHMFPKIIEMGRAFVAPEYQLKPYPLFILWKGIIHVSLRFPEHKYLMGGVSISNQFSDFSKSLMIEFMKSNYYDPFLAQYVHPKKEFKVKLKDADKEFVFDQTQTDLNKFDKLIDEIEPGNLRLPMLIKKYIKQNARLISFNVDPNFNDCIDGLMYIKVAEIPENTVRPVMEEFEIELKSRLNPDDLT